MGDFNAKLAFPATQLHTPSCLSISWNPENLWTNNMNKAQYPAIGPLVCGSFVSFYQVGKMSLHKYLSIVYKDIYIIYIFYLLVSKLTKKKSSWQEPCMKSFYEIKA